MDFGPVKPHESNIQEGVFRQYDVVLSLHPDTKYPLLVGVFFAKTGGQTGGVSYNLIAMTLPSLVSVQQTATFGNDIIIDM